MKLNYYITTDDSDTRYPNLIVECEMWLEDEEYRFGFFREGDLPETAMRYIGTFTEENHDEDINYHLYTYINKWESTSNLQTE